MENKIGQWALEILALAWFIIMPPMCAGQWQGNGQPRFSKVPTPSSVDVDFTKSFSPPHFLLHPFNGCGKQKATV